MGGPSIEKVKVDLLRKTKEMKHDTEHEMSKLKRSFAWRLAPSKVKSGKCGEWKCRSLKLLHFHKPA